MRLVVVVALWVASMSLAWSTAAQAAGPEGGGERRVALVIGNNAGTINGEVKQPDLAFADDDAVRMARVLVELGHEVVLVTRPDAATAPLLLADGGGGGGLLEAMPPTRAAIHAATARLKAGPRPRSFVLFYAGHGDAERGTGSLALEDGVLLHEDLRQIVDDVAAVTSHVILDACNAFFAVHARGPGGRAWRTTETAGTALTSSRSDVGVFVSTSAEAQVWEWDQLQGGVFSHAVRSGLRGGADANLDEQVTYAELLAFVDVAARGLVDSVYAPRVHARAPQADDVIATLRGLARVPLQPSTPGARLTLRDARGHIVLDVRPEAGFAPAVVLPAGALWLEEDGHAGRVFAPAMTAATETETETAHLQLGAATRGPPGVIARLWSTTFGPMALRDVAARPPPPEVFGLSTAREQRLLLHLRTLRDDAVRARHLSQGAGAVLSGTAALGLGVAAVGAAVDEQVQSAWILTGVAGLALAHAALQGSGLLIPIGDDERLAGTILDTPAPTSPRERSARVVRAVETIEGSADDGPALRLGVGAVGVVSGVLMSAAGGLALGCPDCLELSSSRRLHDALGGGFVLFGAVGASLGVVYAAEPTAGERLRALLRDDPESVLP